MYSIVWIAPTPLKVFESEPAGGSSRSARPRQRWAKQVDENVTTLGIRNWRQAATARDVWHRKLAEDKVVMAK